MFLNDAPYLGSINGGSQLRVVAVKLQNYAVLNWLNGGTYGVDVLAPFWADYRDIANAESGHPSDGQYVGMGLQDPRPALYKVASAVRMGGSVHDHQALGEFLGYFESAARSLTDKKSVVDSIKLTLDDKDAPDIKLPLVGSTAIARFLLLDADGVQVPASVDNPLLGFTQMSTSEDPNWVANYGSHLSTGAAGQAVVAAKPGRHTLKATYLLPDGKVEGTLTYIRLNADGSDPTEEKPDPETKRNGA